MLAGENYTLDEQEHKTNWLIEDRKDQKGKRNIVTDISIPSSSNIQVILLGPCKIKWSKGG